MQKLLESPLFLIALRAQFIILLATATYLSLTSSQGVISVNTWDKALHFIGWAGLYGSLQLAFLFRASSLRAASSLLFYSFVIEIAQFYTGRTFSLLDLLANGVGIATATLAILLAKKFLLLLSQR